MSAAGGPPEPDAASRDIRTRTQETVRTGRYSLMGAAPEQARRVWFVLHGYGGLAARFLRPFSGIVPPDTLVVAPEGLSRFYQDMPRADGAHLQRVGATWMTREARELDIADNVRWLDVVFHETMAPSIARGTPAVAGVLGFSQGVATAMRWVADGAIRPQSFVVWAGGLATDVHAERFRTKVANASLVLVAGERDGFVTPELRRANTEALRAYNGAVREILFPGEHVLDPEILGMLMRDLPTHVR